jgi:hypothetical protein
MARHHARQLLSQITYLCKREYVQEKLDEYRALIDKLLHKADLRKIDSIHDLVEVAGGDQEYILIALHWLNCHGINSHHLNLWWLSGLVDLVLHDHTATLAVVAPLERVVLDRRVTSGFISLVFAMLFFTISEQSRCSAIWA